MSQFATQISDDVSELFTFHNKKHKNFVSVSVKYLLDSRACKKQNKTKRLVHIVCSVLECASEVYYEVCLREMNLTE